MSSAICRFCKKPIDPRTDHGCITLDPGHKPVRMTRHIELCDKCFGEVAMRILYRIDGSFQVGDLVKLDIEDIWA